MPIPVYVSLWNWVVFVATAFWLMVSGGAFYVLQRLGMTLIQQVTAVIPAILLLSAIVIIRDRIAGRRQAQAIEQDFPIPKVSETP